VGEWDGEAWSNMQAVVGRPDRRLQQLFRVAGNDKVIHIANQI
jgi:hypothetical protein